MPAFKVHSDFAPAGDQPGAIASLTEGVKRGDRFQTLLGITGSGKSATIAWTIEAVQKPTLVLAPNKSLAAQLANEFKEFFPENRVEYFVSYYDYYQPEAYMPSSDTYIEKDSSVNDEIDRLRHSTTEALLTRSDTIVVASVSAIYGLGFARGVSREPSHRPGGTELRPAQTAAQVGRHAVRTQRHELDPRQVPGAWRHDRDPRRLRGVGDPHLHVRRRGRRDHCRRSPHRRTPRFANRVGDLSCHPLRDRV